jgi:5-methylcytosine-specific restriction protein A
MNKWDVVERQHVLAAMNTYDELGQEVFLKRFGYGLATRYVIVSDAASYESKAVLGVAYRLATGEKPSYISGGAQTVRVLRALGFTIDTLFCRSDRETGSA